jgi:hypothetical protein
MVAHESAELSDLLETYAKQVAAFEVMLDQIRGVQLGDAPMSLEAEGMWPHGG